MSENKQWPDVYFVDEEDNVLGTGQLDVAREKGYIVRISHVLVVNAKGEMLLQQRSQNVWMPGLWNAAAAGHVDAGESYEEAAQRELMEETGIDRKPEEMNYLDKTLQSELFAGNDYNKFHAVYWIEDEGESLVMNEEEVSAVRWISIAELVKETTEHPERFTPVFCQWIVPRFAEEVGKH